MGCLLLRLQHRDFRCLHQVGLYVTQLELLHLGFLLGRQQPAHHTLHLGYEADEQGGVGDVETGVEGGQHHGQRSSLSALVGMVAYEAAHHIDKGIEHTEHPYHAEHIEQQMGQGGPAGLDAGTEGGKIGSRRRSNVLAHHQCYAEIDRKHARGTKQDGDGHDGRRRLHNTCDEGSYGEESQDGKIAARVERCEEGHHRLVMLQVHLLAGGAEHDQREEHEGDAEEEVAHVAVAFLVDEHHAHEEGREDHVRQIDVIAQRHNPCRERSADVGSHDDADGLGQREQSCRHERYRHHRRGRRRLYGACHEGSSQHAREPVGGHPPQDVAQLRTGHLLQGIAHQAHAIDEKTQCAQQFRGHYDIILCCFHERYFYRFVYFQRQNYCYSALRQRKSYYDTIT